MEETKENKTEENQIKEIRMKTKEQTIGYILAAFGLVAGLAWNEAIKSFIDIIFTLDKNSLVAKFAYAIAVTLVVVVISNYLGKIAGKTK